MRASTIGIVGAGQMGGAFARHLAAAGHRTIVVDPDQDRRARARLVGCAVAESVAELLRAAPRVVILSLPSDAAFRDVVGETAAELAAATDRASRPIVVDTSTLALTTKQAARSALAAIGVTLLDCPVSGTGAQAASRDLVVYASGPEAAVTSCADVLGDVARVVHHVGEFGAGTTIKLLANLLVGIHTAAAAEMIALAQRAGVDARDALRHVLDGAGQSRMLELRGPPMIAGDYGFGATIDIYRKDLALIAAFAAEVGAATPLLDVVARLYEAASSAGRGGDELAAVHAMYLSVEH